MNKLLKYLGLCLGAIVCTTSLTSCPGARAASKAASSARAASKAASPAGRTSINYGPAAGTVSRVPYVIDRIQDNNNNNYSYGYSGGNSYSGYGY